MKVNTIIILLLMSFTFFASLLLLSALLFALILFSIIVDRSAVHRLKSKWIWIFFAIILLYLSFFNESDSMFWSIPYSSDNLAIGLTITIRALVIIILSSYLLSQLRHLQANNIFRKIIPGHFSNVFEESKKLESTVKNEMKSLKRKLTNKSIFKNPIELISTFLSDLLFIVEQQHMKEEVIIIQPTKKEQI